MIKAPFQTKLLTVFLVAIMSLSILGCCSEPLYKSGTILFLPKVLLHRRDSVEKWILSDAKTFEGSPAGNVRAVLYTSFVGGTYGLVDSAWRSGTVGNLRVPVTYSIGVGQTPRESDLDVVGVEKIFSLKDGRIAYGFEFLQWSRASDQYWFVGGRGEFDGPSSSTTAP